MEPLRQVGRASGELPPRTAERPSPAPAPGPPGTGARVEGRVVAELAPRTYAVAVDGGGAALVVHSGSDLPLGERATLLVRAPGRPALLVAAPDAAVDRGPTDAARQALRTAGVDFASVVDGERARPAPSAAGQGTAGARVPTTPLDAARALLVDGAPVAADALRSARGGHHLPVGGARLVVGLDGAPAPPGGVYAVARAALPFEVDVLRTGEPARAAAAPGWLAPLLRVLERHDGRPPDPGEALLALSRTLRARAAGDALASRIARELAPPRDGAELGRRATEGGARFEARAARGEGSGALARDLRAVLAAALGSEQTPAVREAVARALDALGTQALLAAARAEAGEPAWVPLPFVDGERGRTAWLRWRREGRGGADGRPGAVRAELAVEFSALGPVHVDAALVRERVVVRVAVAREDALALVRAASSELERRLGALGREVHLGLALEDAERLAVHPDRPPAPDARGWLDAVA